MRQSLDQRIFAETGASRAQAAADTTVRPADRFFGRRTGRGASGQRRGCASLIPDGLIQCAPEADRDSLSHSAVRGTLRMKTDVSFRGPAAPHSLLATRVAGPGNPLSATSWPDAAARTTRVIATRPDRASAGAPNPATGMPTVDFSVAPWVRGSRECSAALPRNDSSRCGAAMGLQPGSAPFAHEIQGIGIRMTAPAIRIEKKGACSDPASPHAPVEIFRTAWTRRSVPTFPGGRNPPGRPQPCAVLIMSNMGRYMATTMPPITTPITTIMIGSRIDVSAVTAASTSSS
jgi:hypothetical protein